MYLNYDCGIKNIKDAKRNYSHCRYIKLIEAFEESGKDICEVVLDADDTPMTVRSNLSRRIKAMKKNFKVSIRGEHLYLYKEM